MLFSTEWLSNYVDLPDEVNELADGLTAAGLAIEGIEVRNDDYLLDVDVTTNRPDCMNHLGLAREIAVITQAKLKIPECQIDEIERATSDTVSIEVEDARACPRYVGRIVSGVRIEPSPDWLCRHLEALGLRPINNIVDITNFVLWETGQPLHAFDLNRLAGSRIIVRYARSGERLVTLDGVDRDLATSHLVIADAESPVALAGIMGGAASEVSESTSEILIESAHFNPKVVRLGANALDLHTDASHRFERGADPLACRAAADRAVSLISEIAGGRALSDAIDVNDSSLEWELRGSLDMDRLAAFGGVEIDGTRTRERFEGLGFRVSRAVGNTLEVVVPSWRYYDFKPTAEGDPGTVEETVFEADLFEEALRLEGYDNIPADLPSIGDPDAGLSRGHVGREKIRRLLASCGFAEAVNYSFHDEASDAGTQALSDQGEPYRIANPLSEKYVVMRRSLLPGLAKSAAFNLDRGAQAVRLFEIGHVFPSGEAAEFDVVAVVAGGTLGNSWQRSYDLDFFDLKGVVELLAREHAEDFYFRPVQIHGFVDGTSAEVHIDSPDGEVVGHVGQLDVDLKIPLFAVEIKRSAFKGDASIAGIETPSRLPGITADVTLTHALAIDWASLSKSIENFSSRNLKSFGLKSRYVGEGVPPGAVNTTIFLNYQAQDRSLTQEEVNERVEALADELKSRFSLDGGQ
jgi:phenylalanyl-tRNA synthetase beta chain